MASTASGRSRASTVSTAPTGSVRPVEQGQYGGYGAAAGAAAGAAGGYAAAQGEQQWPQEQSWNQGEQQPWPAAEAAASARRATRSSSRPSRPGPQRATAPSRRSSGAPKASSSVGRPGPGQQWPQEQQWGRRRRPAGGAVRTYTQPAQQEWGGQAEPVRRGGAGTSSPRLAQSWQPGAVLAGRGAPAAEPVARPAEPEAADQTRIDPRATEPARTTEASSSRVRASRAGGPSLPDQEAPAVKGASPYRSQKTLIELHSAAQEPRGLYLQASRSFAAVLRMMPIADHGLTFMDCRNVISTVSFVDTRYRGPFSAHRTVEVRHVDRKPTCTGERTGSRRSYRDRKALGDCRR